MSELARLRWKCRRGMLELDLLFGEFLDNGYARLDGDERRRFHDLLDYPDAVLLEWLMGRAQPADRDVVQLINKIRSSTVY